MYKTSKSNVYLSESLFQSRKSVDNCETDVNCQSLKLHGRPFSWLIFDFTRAFVRLIRISWSTG